MGLRNGMMSSVAYYVNGDNKLSPQKQTPDAILVQKLMTKMLHNRTKAVVMEASSNELARGCCEEVDFDIAVFTNLSRDHTDFQGIKEEYRLAQAKLFSRMVDPHRHRKIVNVDDTNASFFIAQGNPNVHVLTFAVDNKDADVHPLKFELSLFETTILVNTPLGILETPSCLGGITFIISLQHYCRDCKNLDLASINSQCFERCAVINQLLRYMCELHDILNMEIM